MEEMTAVVLNAKHGAIIMPDAHLKVPFGWTSIVGRMLSRIAELPTTIRAFLMITGIEQGPDGLLHIDLHVIPNMMESGGMAQVEGIIKEARDEAAWTCVRDHKPGWIVHTKRGFPRPMCPACQEAAGLTPECHNA